MTPLDNDPTRLRATVTTSGGWISWTCPLCDHPSVPGTDRRLHSVLTRVRYHLRWRHGYVAIPAWQPEGARRVTAAEVEARRRPKAGRKQPAVVVLDAQNYPTLAA